MHPIVMGVVLVDTEAAQVTRAAPATHVLWAGSAQHHQNLSLQDSRTQWIQGLGEKKDKDQASPDCEDPSETA